MHLLSPSQSLVDHVPTFSAIDQEPALALVDHTPALFRCHRSKATTVSQCYGR